MYSRRAGLRETFAEGVRWMRDPQGVIPGNAMPNMGIAEVDARDIAACVNTIR